MLLAAAEFALLHRIFPGSKAPYGTLGLRGRAKPTSRYLKINFQKTGTFSP